MHRLEPALVCHQEIVVGPTIRRLVKPIVMTKLEGHVAIILLMELGLVWRILDAIGVIIAPHREQSVSNIKNSVRKPLDPRFKATIYKLLITVCNP
jgi:hypothetical protein